MPDRPDIAFTPQHRRVLVVLLSLLIVYVAGRLILNPTFIDDPQPAHPLREAELADRIDPNTADVPTLAALPGLGMKRAADIVREREEFRRRNPGRPAYTRPQDLLRIDGIGYAMMNQLTPYLTFPRAAVTAPATSPA
jgi:DNA uptake protein ComE-like DNA-binding protein